MKRNLCVDEGAVGPADQPIPTDPADFHYAGARKPVLCSNLECRGCGASVRWVDFAAYEGSAEGIRAAHDADDPCAVKGVSCGKSLPVRLYFCRCDWLNSVVMQGLFLRSELLVTDLPEGWTCGGHPPLGLPAELDGVALPAGGGWSELVGEVFSKPVEERTRWARWIKHAFGRLAGTPEQVELDQAISERLFSGDPLHRSRAIRFTWGDVDAPATEMLYPLVADHGPELRAQADPLGGEGTDLYDTAIRALGYHVRRGHWPYEGELRDWFRDHAQRPGRLGGVLPLLAEQDREWLKQRAEALAAASPEDADKLRGKLAAG